VLFEVVFYGVLLVWLAALIPAAVATCLKERWLLFVFGFFAGGITWFIGATSLAPADSVWAKRFYDEKQIARVEDPLRHGRSWRNTGLAAAALVALVVVLGLFAARPSPILGLGGGALQSSVGNDFLLEGSAPCEKVRSGAWKCSRWDNGHSGTVSYRVHTDGLGCWSATRIERFSGEGSPKRFSGCVSLFHYLY